jgi:hypothetical protein
MNTLSINADIFCARGSIVTVHWGVNASLSDDARVDSARIVVVTKCIVDGVDASAVNVARVNSARNTIIAILWGHHTSFDFIARSNAARIGCFASFWDGSAFSRFGIAKIASACIAVITDDCGVSAAGWSASIYCASVEIVTQGVVSRMNAVSS